MPIIQNRNLWAGGSLIAVLLFTSGHMFNHIRKVPYVSGDGRGGISYFAGGFQNQLGLETQIVAAICTCLIVVTTLSVLTTCRWHLGFCYNHVGRQGPTNCGSEEATSICPSMDCRPLLDVQLSALGV
jgi:hypothetical protein